MTDRSCEIQAFLDANGWGQAQRHPLAGDASSRKYERVTDESRSGIVMDVPPSGLDSLHAFEHITAHLAGLGLAPPMILARAPNQGLLLLEDLGDTLFAKVVAQSHSAEITLYHQATRVLAHLSTAPLPSPLPDYRSKAMADAATLAAIWYADTPENAPHLAALVNATLRPLEHQPAAIALRDFHAENLLWLPDREGLKQVGLLDYQDAGRGFIGYDLVSMIQDARRDVTPDVQAQVSAEFAQRVGFDPQAFEAQIAVLGAQRALRILGVFARLCIAYDKPGYIGLIPRVWGQLQDNLRHPLNADLAAWVAQNLPQPTTSVLEGIKTRCR